MLFQELPKEGGEEEPLGMARGPGSREGGVGAGVTLQTPWLLDIRKCIMSGGSDWDRVKKGVGKNETGTGSRR